MFIKCEFSYNIWSFVSQFRLPPIAMNYNIIDWLEYIEHLGITIIKYFLSHGKNYYHFIEYFEPEELSNLQSSEV